MPVDRRLRIALAVAAVLVVVAGVALVAASGDDDGDLATVAGSTSTSSSTSTSTSTTAPADVTSTTVAVQQTTAAPPPSSTAVTRRTATTQPPAPGTCAPPARGSDFDGFGAAEIVIENGAGRHVSCVLTADTPAQQQQGLMRQDDLDGYAAMIFRFPDERERSFWMRNSRIPLSIAFFDAAGRFVSSADMQPCGDSPDCPTYPSAGPARYAIEVVQGRLPAVGATSDSRLTRP
jgi:uncharacterized membrane protein (UPF0127 family)